MAANKGLGNWLLSLPFIARLLIAIFADFIFGICRFVDGIIEKNVLKIIVGFLWIWYGLIIGWILDIVFTIIGKRPVLM